MTISFRVDGSKFSNFTTAAITRSMDRAVSDLQLTVAAWGAKKFPPGAFVEAFVDKQKMLSGYFMRLRKNVGPRSTQTSLVISSKTVDFVDSSAEPQTFVNRTPVQIAGSLCVPHGIEVVSRVDFQPIARVRVQPGETGFQTIERALRGQYGLITDDSDGRLVLTRATTAEDGAKRRLVVGENVLSVNHDFDWSKRFKTYKVLGQGSAVGNVDTEQIGVERDENASRERQLILVGAASQPGVNARNRAAWERNQRIGQGISVSVEVQGWLDPTGVPWESNIMVSMTDDDIGWANIPLLVTAVSFQLDNRGAVTTKLELHPRKGYEPPEQTKARASRSPRKPARTDIIGLRERQIFREQRPAWMLPNQEEDLY